MGRDPFVVAAKQVLGESFGEMRRAIEGAGVDALNWRPSGEGTNSMAVLAVHSLSSTRSWLSCAMGAGMPERDRAAEFRAAADGEDELLRTYDALSSECLMLLDRDAPADWSALRPTHARPSSDAPDRVPASWALLHAIEHFREHVGHIGLTRQLWDAGAGR